MTHEIFQIIKNIKSNPHCSNCGRVHPKIIEYSQLNDEGFTECCNESVCKSEEVFHFGTKLTHVRACCWAVAELEFRHQEIDFHRLDEINKFE